MARKRIVIVGAGPGGLSCAMLLARKGYEVQVFEKQPAVGGRNSAITIDKYVFDTGPTFLMMTFLLRDLFKETGRSLDDYLSIQPLDPMYKLSFADKSLSPTTDTERMLEQIRSVFPGDEKGLALFNKREKIRYEKMYPCLQIPYDSWLALFSPRMMKAYTSFSLGRSLYDVLGDYFSHRDLRIAFTFQAKYLGMSPWECPGAFTIVPYIERSFGIDHIKGGLSRICESMAQVLAEENGNLHLSTPVKQIIVKNRCAQGVVLENGETVSADSVVINADFGHAMENLFAPGIIRKWRPDVLYKKKYSCSTFMLYLGVDTLYNEPHHHIVFADDYQANITDITVKNRLSDDMSFYVRNASITDNTLAPRGHSAIYVLVPVPNKKSALVWDETLVQQYRNKVLDRIEQRTAMKDLRKHIRAEKIITPDNWQKDYTVFLCATFNLGHNLNQMLFMRPHNRFEEVNCCYLTGGGTHPGSGLPTIYESARITASLITKYCPNLGK